MRFACAAHNRKFRRMRIFTMVTHPVFTIAVITVSPLLIAPVFKT